MGVVRVNNTRRIKIEITANARLLRAGMTDVERMLWRSLRGKQVANFRFRRQHPIGKYIADFACIERKLLIELDGGQHQDQAVYDERRTIYLQSQGWEVLRFWNNDVVGNLDGVLSNIAAALTAIPPSQPSPLKGEGAGP
jgi:very-short-patch-repair endonuclease